jgi:hypothetical protein
MTAKNLQKPFKPTKITGHTHRPHPAVYTTGVSGNLAMSYNVSARARIPMLLVQIATLAARAQRGIDSMPEPAAEKLWSDIARIHTTLFRLAHTAPAARKTPRPR